MHNARAEGVAPQTAPVHHWPRKDESSSDALGHLRRILSAKWYGPALRELGPRYAVIRVSSVFRIVICIERIRS